MKGLKKLLKTTQIALFISMLSVLFFSSKSQAVYYKCFKENIQLGNELLTWNRCKTIEDSATPTISDSPIDPEPEYTEYTLSPDPSPSQSFLSPEPSVLPSVTSLPTLTVPSEPPSSIPIVTQDVNLVTLENGVELNKKDAENVEILQSPEQLAALIVINPIKALKVLSSVGKDLPPKKRKQTQQVVFPTIIVSSVIGNTTSMLIKRRVK